MRNKAGSFFQFLQVLLSESNIVYGEERYDSLVQNKNYSSLVATSPFFRSAFRSIPLCQEPDRISDTILKSKKSHCFNLPAVMRML